MYWEQSSRNFLLFLSTIQRLLREPDEDFPLYLIHGFGATWTPDGPRPLILASSTIIQRGGNYGLTPMDSPEDWISALHPANAEFGRRIQEYNPLVIHCPPPRMLSAPDIFAAWTRDALWSQSVHPLRVRCSNTRNQGSIGFPICRHNSKWEISGFITAGHVACGESCFIEIGYTSPRIRLRRWSPVGEVRLRDTPTESSGPAFDIAAVDFNARSPKFLKPIHSGVLNSRATIEEPIEVDITGGASGSVRGFIVGALANFGVKPLTWKDSWVLLPSGVVRHGDSGAPVILPNGEALGMVVSGVIDHRSGEEIFCLAQDISSLEREWLSPRNIKLVPS